MLLGVRSAGGVQPYQIKNHAGEVLFESPEVFTKMSTYLIYASLRAASLEGANLAHSALWEANKTGLSEFERLGDGRYIGYRTKHSRLFPLIYECNSSYRAPVFSTCPYTECHPGLYLWPTLKMAESWALQAVSFSDIPDDIIRVAFKKQDLHGVSNKNRVRAFTVLDIAKRWPSR